MLHICTFLISFIVIENVSLFDPIGAAPWFYSLRFKNSWKRDTVKYFKQKTFHAIILHKGPELFPERVMGAIAKNVIVVLFRYLNCYHRFYLSKLWGKCSLFYLKKTEKLTKMLIKIPICSEIHPGNGYKIKCYLMLWG